MPTKLDPNLERVFVDESGGTDLPPEGETSPDYYVIAGILLPEADFQRSSEAAEKIVRKHAGQGELKSKNLGSNTSRREKVLRDIAESKLPFYCLAVNKTRIWKDSGLRWRPSFYKFLHQMFYSQIKKAFFGVRVLADQYGRTAFMKSFKSYIEERATIFDRFDFSPSPEVPLLQIADVIAGTVRRVYMGEDPSKLLEILDYSSSSIEEWPPPAAWDNSPETPVEFDETITGIALRSAREYVEQNIGSEDEDDGLRAHAIRYLLYRFELNPDEYILRTEITTYLEEVSEVNISEQVLSTKVLAHAKDNDVIITSTEKGVKIPHGAQDLYDWMARAESQVAPYLRRVENARSRILMASHNHHDIADPTTFPELSKYLGNRQGPPT